MKTLASITLPLVLLLAACGDEGGKGGEERGTAAGEVLGGSITDDMLPLDTVTSQSPPLREAGESTSSAPGARPSASATGSASEAADAPDEPAAAPDADAVEESDEG